MFLTRIVLAVRKATRNLTADRRFGLCSVEEFARVLARERARTDRSRTVFCLLTFSPSEKATAQATCRQLAKVLRRRLRCTDEAGWLDGERIAAVLPLTPAPGAWKVADDVCSLLSPKLPRPCCNVYCYPLPRNSALGNGAEQAERRNGDSRGDDSPDANDPADWSDETSAEPVAAVKEESCRIDCTAAVDQAEAMTPLLAKGLPPWKRLLDVLGAGTGLILASPAMLFIALAIKLSSPGPVFFRQRRAGLGGRPFVMIKFRSMVVDAESQKKHLLKHNQQDGPAFKIADDPRTTWLGNWLRRTSLDELPQLWNVLRGEMSLVGPRPLPCDEAEACRGWHQQRLDVSPGLTCIWQVRDRSMVTFAEWVRMDVQYIRERSLRKDLKLILQTIPAIVVRQIARRESSDEPFGQSESAR